MSRTAAYPPILLIIFCRTSRPMPFRLITIGFWSWTGSLEVRIAAHIRQHRSRPFELVYALSGLLAIPPLYLLYFCVLCDHYLWGKPPADRVLLMISM